MFLEVSVSAEVSKVPGLLTLLTEHILHMMASNLI